VLGSGTRVLSESWEDPFCFSFVLVIFSFIFLCKYTKIQKVFFKRVLVRVLYMMGAVVDRQGDTYWRVGGWEGGGATRSCAAALPRLISYKALQCVWCQPHYKSQ
jgi:hypothetical protein